MVWDAGVPIVVKETYYTMYIPTPPPPNSIGSTEENGKIHTKNREIRDPYPTPSINSGF